MDNIGDIDSIDSIAITISQRMIKENGYKSIMKTFQECDGEDYVFSFKCKNLPKREFVYIYWIINGRIRWRSTFLEFKRNKIFNFKDGKKPLKGNFILSFDFQQIPRLLQPIRKGFQGFRYFDSDSIYMGD